MTVTGAVKSVGIVGGGTAGYLCGLALRRRRPDLDVTLIESSKVPVIGVGEGTTPLMVAMLHGYLGLDVSEFIAQVQPTFKLGVRLQFGATPTAEFDFAFDTSFAHDSFVHDGAVRGGSIGAHAMHSNASLAYVASDLRTHSLADRAPYAYHVDNKRLVQYLRSQAAACGLPVVDAHIESVERDHQGVTALQVQGGARLHFDLYVDCSGFRSLLLEQTLGAGHIDYSDALPCDRAIVAQVPHNGDFGPFTLAESMDAGWCWGLPQQDSDHRGYVYSSAFLSTDQAEAEMRSKNPGMGDARELRFASGRKSEWWKDNVVAVGNAYAFVEPLEATSLHMVVREISTLISHLDDAPASPLVRDDLNHRIGDAWDYLRDFLAAHYRFNQRVDSPFWRECASRLPLGELTPLVEMLTSTTSARQQIASAASPFVLGDRVDETEVVLLGQGAVPADRCVPTLSATAWRSHRDRLERMAARTVRTPDLAAVLSHQPGLLSPIGAPWFEAMVADLEHGNQSRPPVGTTTAMAS